MKTEQKELDKSKWGEGPWQHEPDRLEWEHAGFPCLVVRQQLGALCGYVAVPPGHPWHGAHYDQVRQKNGDWVDAHGGLTYSDACAGKICHVPKPGQPDNVWWLGFDCAHSGDLVPYTATFRREHAAELCLDYDTYKDIAYVQASVEALAEQAAEAAKP